MPDTLQIIFKRIHKSYKTDFRLSKLMALRDLSFHVNEGEVFGIIGPNGAGKSTALKILLGFVRPDSGSVMVAGLDPADPASHRALGYLPENPCLYDNLSATEHLAFAARTARLSLHETADRIKNILALVNLDHTAGLALRRYSKGMVQRAALAFALINEPKILVLDEPMSGLDPLGRQLVVDIIKNYHQQGNTILFSSHVLTDVERICNRIGIMNKGRLLTIVTPEEIRDFPRAEGLPASTSPLEAYFLQTIETDNES